MLNLFTTKMSLATILTSTIFFTTPTSSFSSIVEESQLLASSNNVGANFGSTSMIIVGTPEILMASSGVGVNTGTTNAVVGILGGARQECISAGEAYAASCVAKALRKAASRANNPDYYDARRELRNAAKKLDRLVNKNADKKASKKKGSYGTYKAVKQESIATVNKAAIKIIQETETNLLRSSGNEIRKSHYKRIAQAVGSTKVIFRS